MGGDHLWDALGATAETLGAAVIIISILYLSRQIRESTKYASAEAERNIQEAFIQIHDSLSADRTGLEAFRKGLNSFNKLNDSDKAYVHIKLNLFINHLETVLRMRDKGLVDQDISDTYGNVVVGIINTPCGIEYWEQSEHAYQQRSRSYIDENLTEGSGIGDFREVFPYMFSNDA